MEKEGKTKYLEGTEVDEALEGEDTEVEVKDE